MSMLVENNQPVIWRGPMLHGILQQFLTDVDWGDIDYLVIDMPPGTGDVLLSLAELLPRMEVILVTTPKHDARVIASRAAAASIKLKVKLQGVVENMSWFTGRDGTKYALFGEGGGQRLAYEYSVPLLARIPLYYDLNSDTPDSDDLDGSHKADSTVKPILLTASGNEITDIYRKLSEKIATMKPSKIHKRELRIH
jgi:ATP-binding protein involved in chromosome partitioning